MEPFLSASWFEAVAQLEVEPRKGDGKGNGQTDGPTLNLVITDAPAGAEKVNVCGGHIARDHEDDAVATITLTQALAYSIFVTGNFRAAMPAFTAGRITVDGDLTALAGLARSSGDELRELRNQLFTITQPVAGSHDLAGPAAAQARVNSEIERLGLTSHANELAVNGLTIVPPEITGMTEQFIDRVQTRVFDLIEAQSGVRPDTATGETHRNVFYPSLYYFLFEDKIFEELLMNEYALALAAYLCGDDSVLSACTVFLKGPADPPRTGSKLQLGLHTDNNGWAYPEPFPPPQSSLVVNCTWLLDDYTPADGATVYVPGSHTLRRNPVGLEGEDRMVAVEAPRGSLVVWGGNTWHGSLPRTKPGLRAGLAWAITRPFMAPQEPFQLDVSEEILARNSARFGVLLGQTYPTGWRAEGPEALMAQRAQVASKRTQQT